MRRLAEAFPALALPPIIEEALPLQLPDSNQVLTSQAPATDTDARCPRQLVIQISDCSSHGGPPVHDDPYLLMSELDMFKPAAGPSSSSSSSSTSVSLPKVLMNTEPTFVTEAVRAVREMLQKPRPDSSVATHKTHTHTLTSNRRSKRAPEIPHVWCVASVLPAVRRALHWEHNTPAIDLWTKLGTVGGGLARVS